MANVMGYLYFRINLFMSLHFHDWRHVVLAVEDRTAGQIRAQHQLEVACRCRQPVGLVPGGSRALNIACRWSHRRSARGRSESRRCSDRWGCSPCTRPHRSWSATRRHRSAGVVLQENAGRTRAGRRAAAPRCRRSSSSTQPLAPH